MSDIYKWLPSLTGTSQVSAWVEKKKKKKRQSGAEPLRAQKIHNESSALVLAERSTLLTASPVCQSRRTVLCVAEVLGHWIPCFSDSLLGTDPERCCFSLGSPTVTDIHLLFSCRGVKWATIWPISMTHSTTWTQLSLKAWCDDRRGHL